MILDLFNKGLVLTEPELRNMYSRIPTLGHRPNIGLTRLL